MFGMGKCLETLPTENVYLLPIYADVRRCIAKVGGWWGGWVSSPCCPLPFALRFLHRCPYHRFGGREIRTTEQHTRASLDVTYDQWRTSAWEWSDAHLMAKKHLYIRKRMTKMHITHTHAIEISMLRMHPDWEVVDGG